MQLFFVWKMKEDIERIIRSDKQEAPWRSDYYFDTRRTLLERKTSDAFEKRTPVDLYTLLRYELLQHKKDFQYTNTSRNSSDFDDTVSQITTETSCITDDDYFSFKTKKELADAYAFVGMHHIFERLNCGSTKMKWFENLPNLVTKLSFAHNEADKLAFSSTDGIISVCDVGLKPQVIFTLTGHTKSVTGIFLYFQI